MTSASAAASTRLPGPIRLRLPGPDRVRIGAFDILDRLSWSIPARDLPAGEHRLAWVGHTRGGGTASSGDHHLRVTVGETRIERSLHLLW